MRRTSDEFVFGEPFLKIDPMTKTEEDNLSSSVEGGGNTAEQTDNYVCRSQFLTAHSMHVVQSVYTKDKKALG